MKSSDITVTQAEALLPPIVQMYLYLSRLKTRMEQRQFPSDDKYYVRVERALDAIDTLRIRTYYMTVERGVGELPRKV